MQSEGVLRFVTWPAWFLLFSSVALLFAAFARAFSGEFRHDGTPDEERSRASHQADDGSTTTLHSGH